MSGKTLLLLRHAKSSWKDSALEDHARPLNSRGRQAATRIGQLMRDEMLVPDLVLCSTARRTRETAERVFAAADAAPAIVFRDDLYHADPAQIAGVLSQVSQPASSVQIIGHNPGLEEFLAGLVGEVMTLPTGALAFIKLELSDWSDFGLSTRGTLVQLWRPRELDCE